MLVAGLLALLYYAPALVGSSHDPVKNNALAALTGWSPVPADPTFYSSWEEAGRQLRMGHIPIWQASTAQPFLEATDLPAFYPGSVIVYLAGREWAALLFSLAHFWLLGFGLTLLIGNSRSRQEGLKRFIPHPSSLLPCLAVLVLAGNLRPDWLAAISWLPIALLLTRWKRRSLAYVALPLPLALIALSGPFPLTIILYALILFWWLITLRLSSSFIPPPSSLILLLCLLAGLFIAGPQLFPRLSYSGPAFDPAKQAASPPEISGAIGAEVTQVQRQADGQLTLVLGIPAGTERVEFTLKGSGTKGSTEEKPTGWGGQLWQGQGNSVQQKKGVDLKVIGPAGSTGDQRVSLKFDPKNLPTTTTEYTLRLRYNPLSFQLGLYAAFLALVSLGLSVVVLGWVRFYREEESDHPLRRVVKNSATPLFAQLTGKVIDFGFAIFVLRLLGPEGNGQYAFAVTTWVFFAAFCDFGLEGIVTREVARVRQLPDAQEQINRLFFTKLFLRLIFSILALPLALLWIGGFGLTGNLTAGSAWAIILLMIGFWPSVVAGSITVVFRGYEKFEYLAAVQLLASVVKVPLGLGALLAGWGVVGLAGSSVVVNFIQVAVLQALLRGQIFRPRLVPGVFDTKLARKLLHESYPLLLNGLIISVLFKSDGLVLLALRGNAQLGVYNSAYKFIDALLIIPSTLTLALFPLFSAYGVEASANLLRAYREGLRLLMLIAWPVSVGTVFVAYDLIGAMGGTEFLPDGAIALQILIWFLPFSYINGLTQYVLIAINRQRNITGAVVVAAIANLSLNLLLIPFFGYVAAACLTILTELVLLVPFCRIMYRALGPGSVPLVSTNWRPILAATFMAFVLSGLLLVGVNHFVITVVVGVAVYLSGLTLTKAVTRQDLALLKKVIKR